MKDTFRYDIRLIFVLLTQVSRVGAQTDNRYREGFTSIVSTTCNQQLVESYCMGMSEVKGVRMGEGEIIHGRWDNEYFDGPGPGPDAVIRTLWPARYNVELELNDGTFTRPVFINTGFLREGRTQYVGCSDGPNSGVYNSGVEYVRYVDFSWFAIPIGKKVRGARVTLKRAIDNTGFGTFIMLKSAGTCADFNTAPTLSKTTISNRCPSITLDLNSLVTSTKPSGSTLKWYTDAARTTELTTPTAVTANGTYYAFYNYTNGCSSRASAVQAKFISCPINIDNTCPSPSVDLSFSLDSNNVVPEGYTQTYHSATPASSANRLPSSVVTSSGTYYYALFSESLTSYSGSSLRPLVVTITNCCVTAN